MKKVIVLSLLVFYFMQYGNGQRLMDLKVSSLSGEEVSFSDYGGKKLVFIVLPIANSDSIYQQVVDFESGVSDSIVLIGLFSYETGFKPSMRSSLLDLYRNMNIVLLDGVYAQDTTSSQTDLLKWLTKMTLNYYTNAIISGVGHKFFVNQTARLYGVLPPQVSVQSPVTKRFLSMNAAPFPKE